MSQYIVYVYGYFCTRIVYEFSRLDALFFNAQYRENGNPLSMIGLIRIPVATIHWVTLIYRYWTDDGIN